MPTTTATSITDAIGLLNNAPDGHGWTDRDARIGAKLAAKINLGVPLTVIETRSTWRKLDAEYRDRLTALGVTELQAPPADTAPPTDPAPNQGEATVRIGIVGAGPKRRILTDTPYSFADRMKRIPGGEFHAPKRCRSCTAHKTCHFQGVAGWHYPPTNTAARAIAEATRGERTLTDPAFQALLADAETAVQSRALRSALDLPDIPGLKTTAWLHQKQAFQFAVAQDGCILDMDMGTGKSLTAVGRIVAAVRKATAEGRRFAGIILCPERVVGVWPKQFRIHAEDEFHVVEGRRENRNGEHVFLTIAERVQEFEYALHECPCERPHVVMMNYAATIYEPFKAWSLRQSWDILVLDEIHKIKSPSGKWAQHAYKLGQRSAVRLGLTGTLMPHSPMDVFSQMRAVDAGVFGTTEGKFKHTFMEMGGFQGKVALGLLPEMEAAFAQQVSDHTYRVGSEVLDLPEAVPDVDLMCSLPKEQARVYRELESSLFSEIQVMLDNGKTLEAAVSADNVLVKMLRLQQITGGAVRLDDPEDEAEPEVDGEAFDPATGELLGRPARSRKPARMLVFQEQPKAKLLKDLLEDIDPVHPVVVFCKFRNDLDQVEAVAADMGRTYGELSGRRSDAVTRDSTLVPGVQIAGVQLQAGGTGIDFTASHYCVYYSLSHSLGDFLQSRKRLHRPGQGSAVRFLHLVMDGTIDQAVYAALEARESVAKHVGALIRARQEAKA